MWVTGLHNGNHPIMKPVILGHLHHIRIRNKEPLQDFRQGDLEPTFWPTLPKRPFKNEIYIGLVLRKIVISVRNVVKRQLPFAKISFTAFAKLIDLFCRKRNVSQRFGLQPGFEHLTTPSSCPKVSVF